MKKTNKNNNESDENSANFLGSATVGTKGQIVIPKAARDKFNIEPGDEVLVFGGDNEVIALIKSDKLNEIFSELNKFKL
jgi:AbrB family looped-hinge helix DNA binding protein